MSTTAKRRINKIADRLQKVADGITNALELVVLDNATPKRPRRTRVERTRRTRRSRVAIW